MEQASDGIAIYDLKGNVVEANSRACEMLGYTLMLSVNLSARQFKPHLVEDIASAKQERPGAALLAIPIEQMALVMGKSH